MVLARSILALMLMVPTATVFAVALQVGDLSGAALLLDGASRDPGEMALPGSDHSAVAGGKPIDSRVFREVARGQEVFQPAFSDNTLPRLNIAPDRRGAEPGGVSAPVPAPAAIWAFGVALIGFAGIARRRGMPDGDQSTARMDVAANI